MTSIQATPIDSFKASNLVFDPVTKRSIPDSDLSYYQSNISYRYPDGTKGPLIFQLPRCPTFGVSNKFGDSADKLSLSIVLGERENWSTEHKHAVDVLNSVVAACKAFTLTE